MGDVRIAAPEGMLDAYAAEPHGEGPFPGVVVLHEAFGLTDDIRQHTDRLASEGYLAVAPDLYSWGLTPRCLVATMRASMRGEGRAYGDVEASRAWLARHADCTGKVGVVGFCMGGGLALAATPRGIFDAAAPNYGEVPDDADEALAGACPVVASYGGRDRMMRGRAERLTAALEALGVPHDVKVYPEASHGFLNRHSGIPAVLDRVTGFGFRPEESDDAWQRILGFFDEHLRS